MQQEPRAPYAPTGAVIAAIHHFRDKGFPAVIDAELLSRIGIKESLASWVINALRFLDLVTEEGKHAAQFDTLRKASDTEYPNVLAGILRNAYHLIFEIIPDPSKSTREAIDTAFKGYQPHAQRMRMVALFLGLCLEAQMIPDSFDIKPTTSKTRINGAKRERNSKPNSTVNTTASVLPANHSRTADPSTGVSLSSGENTHYDLVMAFIRRLPQNRKWTKQERDRWLHALSASIDLEIEVLGDESSTSG
jgi:Family of unknown function (DUF5343)